MITTFALRRLLPGHLIAFAEEHGWDELTNGNLLAAAEAAGFDVLLTADRNLRCQQDLTGRSIGLVVLSTNRWPVIRGNAPHVLSAVERAGRGQYVEAGLPRPVLLRRLPSGGNR